MARICWRFWLYTPDNYRHPQGFDWEYQATTYIKKNNMDPSYWRIVEKIDYYDDDDYSDPNRHISLNPNEGDTRGGMFS